MYFTNKIRSYSDFDLIYNKWFIDYLKEDALFSYMVFGKDIFSMLGYDLEVLEKGMLTGYLLEVYVVGPLAYKFVYVPFSYDKLQDNDEVDVFINQFDLLMELSVCDKTNSFHGRLLIAHLGISN